MFPQLIAAEPNDAVPGLGRMIEEELANPRPVTGTHRTSPRRQSNRGNVLLIAAAAAIVIVVVVLIVLLRLGGRGKERAKVGLDSPAVTCTVDGLPSLGEADGRHVKPS